MLKVRVVRLEPLVVRKEHKELKVPRDLKVLKD